MDSQPNSQGDVSIHVPIWEQPLLKHHHQCRLYVLSFSVKHRIPHPAPLHAPAALAQLVRRGILSLETTYLENNLSTTFQALVKQWDWDV